jgi:hypothetical protein
MRVNITLDDLNKNVAAIAAEASELRNLISASAALADLTAKAAEPSPLAIPVSLALEDARRRADALIVRVEQAKHGLRTSHV